MNGQSNWTALSLNLSFYCGASSVHSREAESANEVTLQQSIAAPGWQSCCRLLLIHRFTARSDLRFELTPETQLGASIEKNPQQSMPNPVWELWCRLLLAPFGSASQASAHECGRSRLWRHFETNYTICGVGIDGRKKVMRVTSLPPNSRTIAWQDRLCCLPQKSANFAFLILAGNI